MLEISDLTVRYPRQSAPVLSALSLNVTQGERVAIVGPSGAGKTTLFRAITGFLPTNAGRIAVDGIDVTTLRGRGLRELRRRVAYISQRHDLIDRLLVHQNVTAGLLGRWPVSRALRYLVWPRRSELDAASAALARVGIPHKLRSRTTELSGGEQQRVAIARALLQQPALLLADEPVASLDPERSERILDLLCGLAAETGIALLCALHQWDLARGHFDRVLVIERGRLIPESGNPALAAVRAAVT